jgi:CheY-like chemotaxis protein
MVLGLGLPDVDGLEVLAAAREHREVPVVVLTARSQVEDRIEGLRRGADEGIDEVAPCGSPPHGAFGSVTRSTSAGRRSGDAATR